MYVTVSVTVRYSLTETTTVTRARANEAQG